MSSNYTLIRLERSGHVAEVVLDSPERLNAMSPTFFEEIKQVFEEVDADDSIRVAILWAEGRHFTCGLDLKTAGEAIGTDESGNIAAKNMTLYRHILHLQDCISAPEKCRKPVIAAVHGHCVGGGVDLTTACDIRLCTKEATFGIHETKIAIVADVGTLQRITRVVGHGMAREMAYTGKRLIADRALRCGMVNEVYDTKEDLLAGAREMAAEIAANSPMTVQGVKTVLQQAEAHTIEDGLEYVAQWNSSFLNRADLAEAIQAFAEKRAPQFSEK